MSPEEIEAMFRAGRGPVHSGSDDDEEITLSQEEQALRTHQLKDCLMTAQLLWSSGSSDLDQVVEKLADGSRDDSWRPFIGSSGLLDFLLALNSVQSLRQTLRIHLLRVIGNSCADTDENRARVLAANSLPSIIRLLNDDSVLAFVIPVLYNIGVDYEPAQLAASQAGLSSALVGLISGPRLRHCQAFLNIICKVLGFVAVQDPEVNVADPATPIYLLNLATNSSMLIDLEDFCALTSVALVYLANEKFQQALISHKAVPTLQAAFSRSYTQFDVDQADPDEAAQLRQVRNAFVQVIADVSALPEFPLEYPLTSTAVHTFRSWLSSGYGYAGLETAACLALGNLSRSDESSTFLVQVQAIQDPLIALLSKPYPTGGLAVPPPQGQGDTLPPSQLLHAILSFLKNLAIPQANKPILGAHLLAAPQHILPRLWSATATQPQTQFAAVSLTRLLLVACPANVGRFCAPLSQDPASPARDRSNLHVLSSLFGRTDAEPTKMEAARAVAAVCRVLHSSPSSPLIPGDWGHPQDASILQDVVSAGSDDTDTTETATTTPENAHRARFYAAHAADLVRLLGFLLTQTKFPSVRSEAWFVLALMSRSDDGAKVAIRVLEPLEACRALVETVTGKDMLDGRDLQQAGGGPGEEASGSLSLMQGGGGGGGADSVMAGLGGLELEPQQVDPAQAANMAKVDRENGLVLVAQLVKEHSEYLPPPRYSIFVEMVKKGGEIVLHDRA